MAEPPSIFCPKLRNTLRPRDALLRIMWRRAPRAPCRSLARTHRGCWGHSPSRSRRLGGGRLTLRAGAGGADARTAARIESRPGGSSGGVALVAMMVIGGGLAAFLLLRGGGESATAEEVVLEPVGVETPDPLTNSVATQTENRATRDPRAGACPPGRLGRRTAVGRRPTGALRWHTQQRHLRPGEAHRLSGGRPGQGVPPGPRFKESPRRTSPAYLRSLTPVTLTRDTRVTTTGGARATSPPSTPCFRRVRP
jgi:hypothetical protein